MTWVLIAIAAIILALFLGGKKLGGFFGNRLGKESEEIPSVPPGSISLVILEHEHDMTADIPKLLESCGYRILESSRVQSMSEDIYSLLLSGTDQENQTVFKAYYRVENYTILIEPEMSFLSYKDLLPKFCSEYSTTIAIVIWQPDSQTAILAKFSSAGLVSQTCYSQGQPAGEQKMPYHCLQDRPNREGLVDALSEMSIPVSQILGKVYATVLKLEK